MCAELLKNEGNILIIFPEGTRTTNGELGRFRSGIGRLIVGKGLAVVPCHLQGGFEAWPKGKLLPRPRRLRLRIGAPCKYEHLDKSAAAVKEICHDLQDRVAELGGRDA